MNCALTVTDRSVCVHTCISPYLLDFTLGFVLLFMKILHSSWVHEGMVCGGAPTWTPRSMFRRTALRWVVYGSELCSHRFPFAIQVSLVVNVASECGFTDQNYQEPCNSCSGTWAPPTSTCLPSPATSSANRNQTATGRSRVLPATPTTSLSPCLAKWPSLATGPTLPSSTWLVSPLFFPHLPSALPDPGRRVRVGISGGRFLP